MYRAICEECEPTHSAYNTEGGKGLGKMKWRFGARNAAEVHRESKHGGEDVDIRIEEVDDA